MKKSKKSKMPKYSLLLQWSNVDNTYVVFLPEWEGLVLQPVTDGATYEEAARNGEEVLEMLIEDRQGDGKPLPEPNTWKSQNLDNSE